MKRMIAIIITLIFTSVIGAYATVPYATFSIVGADPQTGELGVAVASKYFSVGSVVPWAKSGVGAIATQAWVNYDYGIVGLELLEKGYSVKAVVDSLTKADPNSGRRQLGVVDKDGNGATYTGKECISWAGGMSGKNCVAQGNILVDSTTVIELVKTFEITTGTLGDKLMAALLAGDAAGGDSRGKQSAALLVVKAMPGYRYDREIDIRVDDHQEPFQELNRLYGISRALAYLSSALAKYTNGDLPGAVLEARQSVEMGPNLPETYYDLACYLSLSGQIDEALKNITTALKMAPHYKGMAQKDTDLKNLWELPEFKKLVK